jgi:hypothetical protein
LLLNREKGGDEFDDKDETKKAMSYYDEGDLAELLKDINEFYGNDILR